MSDIKQQNLELIQLLMDLRTIIYDRSLPSMLNIMTYYPDVRKKRQCIYFNNKKPTKDNLHEVCAGIYFYAPPTRTTIRYINQDDGTAIKYTVEYNTKTNIATYKESKSWSNTNSTICTKRNTNKSE